jgi:hypothetical protein
MIGKSPLAFQLRIKLRLSRGQAPISRVLSKIRERRNISGLFLKVEVLEQQKICSKTTNALRNNEKKINYLALMISMNTCSKKTVRSKRQLPLFLLPKFPGS